MRHSIVLPLAAALSLFATGSFTRAQEKLAEPPKPAIPVISDEPKTIDPAQFMPSALAAPATVEFKETPLREVIEWLRVDRKLAVMLDGEALAELQVLPSDPVSDRLAEAPAYLLLNRLSALGLAWYFEDDVLYVTSPEVVEQHQTTASYGVGDLLDSGYKGSDLIETLVGSIAPETWEEVGGEGAVSLLGDVLFIRQRDDLQRQVQGLLAALRSHGRRTLIYDPPAHEVLRQKLEEVATVDFRDTSLETAAADLSKQAGLEIRLHEAALKDAGIRGRQQVSLSLTNRKLKTIVQALGSQLKLTSSLRDGVLWLTTPEHAEELPKTAVFDVRDLCRDAKESAALAEAITSQTEPEAWDEVGGPATLTFARPGTMVINGEEALLTKVLDLLEAYRTALRASKPRTSQEDEANKIETVYYRLHANVAENLEKLLPSLLRAESWKSPERPTAPGEIRRVDSKPEPVVDPQSPLKVASSDDLLIARSVLIVTQTKGAHKELRELIRRIEQGDPDPTAGGGGFGKGGMGGGGFGGGFFDVPSRRPKD